MINPFTRNTVRSDISTWWFNDLVNKEKCFLYGTCSSLTDLITELTFIEEASKVNINDEYKPLLPVPPSGDRLEPFPLRTLDKASDIPVDLAKTCWMYYPELVKESELKKYKISKSALNNSKFTWVIDIHEDHVEYSIQQVIKKKVDFNTDKLEYGSLKTILSGRDIFAGI